MAPVDWLWIQFAQAETATLPSRPAGRVTPIAGDLHPRTDTINVPVTIYPGHRATVPVIFPADLW